MDQPRLSHSQNFLRGAELVEKLVEQSSLTSDDTVLEIGPGKGIITEVLAKHSKQVVAIEADKDLYAALLEKFSSQANVEIRHQDFLTSLLPKNEYKVFSNIPFNITADIIKKNYWTTVIRQMTAM